jgi:hypothetical protein
VTDFIELASTVSFTFLLVAVSLATTMRSRGRRACPGSGDRNPNGR